MTYHAPRSQKEYEQRQLPLWLPIEWSMGQKNIPRPYLNGCPSDINAGITALFSLHRDHAADLHVSDAITRHWIGWETPSNSRAYVDELLVRANQGLIAAWVAYSNIDEDGHYKPLLGWRDCGRMPLGVVYIDALAEPFFGAWHELNFWLHEEHWGHGHAVRMASAALDWVRDNSELDRMMLSWTDGNLRSARAISKLLDQNQEPQVVNAVKNGRDVLVFNHVIGLAR